MARTISSVKLSAALIVQNEAARLPRCLEALAFCDEIVVVDGGSNDATRDIVGAQGARLVERPFDDFARQREAARLACTGDWVLSIDADERVSENLAAEIRAVVQSTPHAALSMPFANHFDGTWLRHGGLWPDRHVRLFRRDRARWDPARPVHEALLVEGSVGRLEAPMLHHTYDSLAHALAKMERYAETSALSLFAAGRRATTLDVIVRPVARFVRAFVLRLGFLDGTRGAQVAWIRAYEAFRRYGRLRELSRRRAVSSSVRPLLLVSSSSRTGSAEGVLALATYLRAQGHDAHLAIDTATPGDLTRWITEAGLPPPLVLKVSRQVRLHHFASDVMGLARHLRRGDFDLLNANMAHDHLLAWTARTLARASRVRIVRTAHRRVDLTGAARRWMLNHADGVVVAAQAYRRDLVASGFDPERVITIPGAVDAQRFSPGESHGLRGTLGISEDAPVVGIVARLKADRDHAALIDAFTDVHRTLPTARLVLFGRGEAEPTLRAQAAPLGDAIVFAGYVTGERLVDAYRMLDVAAWLREGNDGACRGVLEAMACGCPVVVGNDGAAPELVEGAGFAVDPRDRNALGRALHTLLSDASLRRALGTTARERARTFTNDRRGAATLAFYERIRALPSR